MSGNNRVQNTANLILQISSNPQSELALSSAVGFAACPFWSVVMKIVLKARVDYTGKLQLLTFKSCLRVVGTHLHSPQIWGSGQEGVGCCLLEQCVSSLSLCRASVAGLSLLGIVEGSTDVPERWWATIPGGDQETLWMWYWRTWLLGMVVMGWQLYYSILLVFSKLYGSVTSAWAEDAYVSQA